jgi:hypothetical protein
MGTYKNPSKAWGCGSNGRVPAQQAQNFELKIPVLPPKKKKSKERKMQSGVVIHACNPSYSGGEGRRIMSSRPV